MGRCHGAPASTDTLLSCREPGDSGRRVRRTDNPADGLHGGRRERRGAAKHRAHLHLRRTYRQIRRRGTPHPIPQHHACQSRADGCDRHRLPARQAAAGVCCNGYSGNRHGKHRGGYPIRTASAQRDRLVPGVRDLRPAAGRGQHRNWLAGHAYGDSCRSRRSGIRLVLGKWGRRAQNRSAICREHEAHLDALGVQRFLVLLRQRRDHPISA